MTAVEPDGRYVEIERARMAWAVQWRCGSLLDGTVREFVGLDQLEGQQLPAGLMATWPALLFETRERARQWVRDRYGVEATDADREEPAGWRRPRIVRARAVVEVVTRHQEAST
jgi:hypothetical protein